MSYFKTQIQDKIRCNEEVPWDKFQAEKYKNNEFTGKEIIANQLTHYLKQKKYPPFDGCLSIWNLTIIV